MFVIRPVAEKDLDSLEKFAHTVSLGVVSLPKDRNLLQKKILESQKSFSKKVAEPKEEFYFFILENVKTQEAVGTCGIYAKTGIKEPLYYFHIETLTPKSKTLPVPKEIHTLHPIADTNGPSELCSLFLVRELRKEGLGELLSLSRLLFVSQFPERFDNTIFANLRGVIDRETKRSPFWEGWGMHFLQMNMEDVSVLRGKGYDFVQEFLPKYPLYTSFLPQDAQDAIRKIHVSTEAAFKILKKEGFFICDKIDLFDGGPFVCAPKSAIRIVKESTLATLEETPDTVESPLYLLSNAKIDYRACYGTLRKSQNGSVIITKDTSQALQVKIGDPIRYVTAQKK